MEKDKTRHTCIVCNKKRYGYRMAKYRIIKKHHWTCNTYSCINELSALNGQLASVRENKLFLKLFYQK